MKLSTKSFSAFTRSVLVFAVFALNFNAQNTGKPSGASMTPQAAGVSVQSLVKLDNPWGMTFLPDGRLLITEKPGRLRIWADGKLSEPVGGVPKVVYQGQGGLLDVEIDPNFKSNGLVYLYFVEAAEQQPANATDPGDPRFGSPGPGEKPETTLKGGAVARGKLTGNQLTDVTVIWRQVPKTIGRGHFGGRLVFAPDGKLFITSGERMRFDPAQALDSNLGKVVRIDADGTMPKDNPAVSKTLPGVYTLGHRNALGAAINPATKELWINEMGPKGGDELNIIKPGLNYGWPTVSNGDNYDDSPIPDHPTQPRFEQPIRSWTPVISPSGFIFYSGKMFPSWRGNALIGGLSSMAVIRLMLDGNRVTGEERLDMGKRIRDVIEAPDGSVLLLVDGDNGELLRLTPAASKAR